MKWIILSLFMIFASSLSDHSCGHSASHCNKYCRIHPYHVLCAYPSKGRKCINLVEYSPNTQQQQEILDVHNGIRQNVALGLERRGRGGPMPPAANMMKLEWDPELAKMAQRTANQCIVSHDCNECRTPVGRRFRVGQNIAFTESPLQLAPKDLDFVTAIKKFYDCEANTLNPANVNHFVYSEQYSNYSQLIWGKTKLIGCGAARFKSEQYTGDAFLVICNYGPSGNIVNTVMYSRGQACSQCPKGTSCDLTFHGLCGVKK